jgi:hypothetical protein
MDGNIASLHSLRECLTFQTGSFQKASRHPTSLIAGSLEKETAMSNMWGRSGAPMVQPTKNEIRSWLAEARNDLKDESRRRRVAEYKLGLATRTLGTLVLEGKVAVPLERLGEIVLELAEEREVARETQKLLTE